MDETSKKALELHKKYQGKIAVYCKMPVNPPDDLTLAYTPGVAAACREVLKDPLTAYDYTSKGNMVAGIIIMVATNILTWQDILSDTGAWDAMIWMGGVVALASLLNNSGFIAWFAQSITSQLTGISWQIAFVLLLLVYLYSHYAFASLSAHVTAMYAAFPAVMIAAGTPAYLAAFGLAACSTLFAALTNYASGPAPLFFGAGYISQKNWLTIGFICSLINFIIWIGLGSFYWKIIRLW
ncbi:anion permease [uncultured Mitsuokella sp.]|uniref:anion permease n=1 Tax=uncultured Mitsuokella sp. TaxID=453120 RepID=UPI00266F5474|nr:anion permease [uncultured Mitsuokella sp.]